MLRITARDNVAMLKLDSYYSGNYNDLITELKDKHVDHVNRFILSVFPRMEITD